MEVTREAFLPISTDSLDNLEMLMHLYNLASNDFGCVQLSFSHVKFSTYMKHEALIISKLSARFVEIDRKPSLVSLDEIIAHMPKVELHAHLNGSIGEDLLNHLNCFAERDANTKSEEFPLVDSAGVLLDVSCHQKSRAQSDRSNKARSLKECWDSFSKIHDAIRTTRILYVATVNVIAEFSRDNVIYLELRTGPKKIHEIPSKMAYLEAVLKGIEDGQKKFPILVKLLISVDRKRGVDEAYEIIEIAKKVADRYPEIVVGLDVSGDPNHGHPSWIVGVMQEARKRGLKISCHLPEIVNPDEGMDFMKFGPERVGHGQFLHPLYGGTEELWMLAKQKRIPIETCISSNLASGVAASVEEHVVKAFHDESLPFIICTDDCGVFDTSLTNEFRKFASVVQTNTKELLQLCLDAVTYAFASDAEKEILKDQIMQWWQTQEEKSEK